MITSDSTLLSRYFNNNHVIWVFFVSMNSMATGYAGILIWRILWNFCRRRTTQKHLLIAYAVAALLVLSSAGIEGLMLAVNGFCPIAVAFAGHYLTQTLLVGLYADIHWPLLTMEMAEDQRQLRRSEKALNRSN
jgi:hypothetical protein